MYEYGSLYRPVSSFTIPAGFVGFGSHKDFPHGTVKYNEPITRRQQEHFDLYEICTDARRDEIARSIAVDFAEYAEEHRDTWREDPRYLKQQIASALCRHPQARYSNLQIDDVLPAVLVAIGASTEVK